MRAPSSVTMRHDQHNCRGRPRLRAAHAGWGISESRRGEEGAATSAARREPRERRKGLCDARCWSKGRRLYDFERGVLGVNAAATPAGTWGGPSLDGRRCCKKGVEHERWEEAVRSAWVGDRQEPMHVGSGCLQTHAGWPDSCFGDAVGRAIAGPQAASAVVSYRRPARAARPSAQSRR